MALSLESGRLRDPTRAWSAGEVLRADHGPLEIAFVNLMPDSAFADTETQFLGLLRDASCQLALPLRVSRYWISQVARGPAAMRRIGSSYQAAEVLMDTRVDGLILTGTEPLTASLEGEEFWPTLRSLLEWSTDHAPSVVLSCLAAHAAAKLFDGVERCLLPQKLSGVFATESDPGQKVARGLPGRIRIPHSRCNDIPTSWLEARGYRPVLRRGESWTAMESDRSQARFLMFQGHPEYAPNSLLREHRRDVRRYLNQERETYPAIPEGYLDEAGVNLLRNFAQRCQTIPRDPDAIRAFPTAGVERRIQPSWRRPAVQLYANWLGQVLERRVEPGAKARIEVSGTPTEQRTPVNA